MGELREASICRVTLPQLPPGPPDAPAPRRSSCTEPGAHPGLQRCELGRPRAPPMPGFAPEGCPCLCRWPWCGSALFWAWDGGSLDLILHVACPPCLSNSLPGRLPDLPLSPSSQTTQMPQPAHVLGEGSEARGGVWPA